ncbi:phospholipase D-like domain-containing protein [Draconibacterium halophilum]|uniref:phospholipase D-like domain-containing protein n=1 Tax=Draconibacterium halophilum TaxID=2706887 RepID=UPI003742900C
MRIIIPEKSDAIISRWCSFAYVEELLEAGVRIFLYQKGFIHSKYLLVDDCISSVGTSNFDFRSFETNFEANAFIYQKEFTREVEQHFLADLQQCREVKYREWRKRPHTDKIRESLAYIVSPMF